MKFFHCLISHKVYFFNNGKETVMNSPSLSNTARFAGALYLIWIITGLFSIFYLPSQINTHADAVTAAQAILSKEFLFRAGIVLDLISCTLWVLMVMIFYRMFKTVDERQAKLLVAFVLVQIPVVIITATFKISSMMLVKGEILKTFEASQRQDIALLLLNISDYGTPAFELFWGLWLFPLAQLTYQSRFLPRFLGVWLYANGIVYVVMSFLALLFPEYNDL